MPFLLVFPLFGESFVNMEAFRHTLGIAIAFRARRKISSKNPILPRKIVRADKRYKSAFVDNQHTLSKSSLSDAFQ